MPTWTIFLFGDNTAALFALVYYIAQGAMLLLDRAPAVEVRAGRHAKPRIAPEGLRGYVHLLPVAGVFWVVALSMLSPSVSEDLSALISLASVTGTIHALRRPHNTDA